MKKIIGKKWGQLTEVQQYELLSKANVWDNIKEGDCILDFDENLSVGASIVNDEIVVDDDAILYDPTA